MGLTNDRRPAVSHGPVIPCNIHRTLCACPSQRIPGPPCDYYTYYTSPENEINKMAANYKETV